MSKRLAQHEKPESFAQLWYPAWGCYRGYEVGKALGYETVWREDFEGWHSNVIVLFQDGERVPYFAHQLFRFDPKQPPLHLIEWPAGERQQGLFF